MGDHDHKLCLSEFLMAGPAAAHAVRTQAKSLLEEDTYNDYTDWSKDESEASYNEDSTEREDGEDEDAASLAEEEDEDDDEASTTALAPDEDEEGDTPSLLDLSEEEEDDEADSEQ